ncbi:MAG: transporter substrate-binding domain-containing protein, partial [Crocinitomicaceae bacterium]|nr:transporter substrate-binding domain-containing protein [Crocinitomicaceae bacterium]
MTAHRATAQKDYFSTEDLEWIAQHPTIQFGYEPDWPPYEIYTGKDYTGIVGDYVKIIERETGIDFQPIKDITWEESLNKLKTGEIKFVPSCGITDQRKKYLSFTSVIVSDPLVIVTRKDGDFVGGMSYLDGKKIALPKNYYTVEMIR